MFISNSAIEDGYVINNSLRLRASASAYLSRTPSVTGNRQKWKFSSRVKLGALNTSRTLFSAGTSPGGTNFYIGADNCFHLTLNVTAAETFVTNAVYRDTSGWYDIELEVDTTQAVASDRARLKVNGVQVTSFSGTNYPAQNFNTQVNESGRLHTIGRESYGSTQFFDGYIAEPRLLDGVTGEVGYFDPAVTNWWRPKKYTGTYGTNGFYLPFSNGTSLTTLGADASGNGNNWTLNNVSLTAGPTYDWMLDSPTNGAAGTRPVGNYATLNPLNILAGNTALGNLRYSSTSAHGNALSTIGVRSGKVYAEATVSSSDTNGGLGFATNTTPFNVYPGASAGRWWLYQGMAVVIPSGSTNYTPAFGQTAGTTYTMALDRDAGKAWLGNGTVWLDSTLGSTGNPETGANPTFTFSTTEEMFFMFESVGIAWGVNFGQRPFSYTPPTGFRALCAANLPVPTGAAANPRKHHNVYTVTKSGNTNFTLDWDATLYDTRFDIKRRDASGNWYQIDGLRGYDKYLSSNNINNEVTDSNVIGVSGETITLKSTLPDGVYLIEAWKAGLASARQTNTSGSITSTVSANTDAGFSIVIYTGTGFNATIGHGLGIAPSMAEFKRRNGNSNFVVYHVSLGATKALFLDLPDAAVTASSYFNNTAPTSTVFSLGTVGALNDSGTSTHVAYFHAETAGYSEFGSATMNSSADNAFAYAALSARSLLAKRTDSSSNWLLLDNARQAYNVQGPELYKNSAGVESTVSEADLNANGIKFRNSGLAGAWIFAAFADLPFQFANAR